MAEVPLVVWLRDHEKELVDQFVKVAGKSKAFPGFAALSAGHLQLVMQREFNGLLNFVALDTDALKRSVEDHRAQAAAYLSDIPLEEQMLNSVPAAEPLRATFRQRIDSAASYYKSITYSLSARQRLRG